MNVERVQALLQQGLASLRRLVRGPATLERTLVLTLGGLLVAWAGVGASKVASNQARTAGPKGARGSRVRAATGPRV